MSNKITRRGFVKGTLGVGAAVFLGACGEDEGSSAQGSDTGADVGVDVGVDSSVADSGMVGADSGVPDTGGVDAAVEDVGPSCEDLFATGERVSEVPFLEDPRTFHEAYNRGHDGRLLTDLSVIEPGVETIQNDHFYIRTLYPDQLDHQPGDPWEIRLRGLVEEERTVMLSELESFIEPMGTYVLECSGNSRNGSFGLMSAAQWSGIPIARVLELVTASPEAIGVAVSGFDLHTAVSTHSTPGASWIYTFEQLAESGAFLATHMNGEPLPADHGFPVRLYVPNWYGCCCIKWLDELRFVGPDEPATPQMVEFATRTHQPGGRRPPEFAKDYRAATMDQSAMPVRVEQWEVDGEVVYRVIGIMWGGYAVTDALTIRFGENASYVPVDVCPAQMDNEGWTVWVHAWRPTEPGEYVINCQIDDASVPTIRLDSGYYDRPVRIDVV